MNEISLSAFPGADALARLRAAALHLKAHPGTCLTVPPGVYVLTDARALAWQTRVMAGEMGDNPYLHMFSRTAPSFSALDFTGVRNCRVNAYGAIFLMDGFFEPFTLDACEDVEIAGVTLDMCRRAHSRGEIVRVDENSFDARFENQTMIGPNMPAPRILFVNRKLERIIGVLTADVVSDAKKAHVAPGVVRFFRRIPQKWLGLEANVMHAWHSRPAILIHNSARVTLTDVKIQSHPGMGVVGHRSRDILLSRVMICPAPGESVSTCTDATHFVSCQGTVRIENCVFSGQGDDTVNIHGFYLTLLERLGKNQYLAGVRSRTGTHSQKPEYPDAGDEIAFARKRDLAQAGGYRVLACDWLEEQNACAVTLNAPLPEDCLGNYLMNLTQRARLEFVGNHVSNHLARALLVRTKGALIQGNQISHSLLSAVHISAEAYWHECGGAEDVIVRANRIYHCGEMDGEKLDEVGGVHVYVGAAEAGAVIHKNILIEDNVIDCPRSPYAVRAYGASGLRVCANQHTGQILAENCPDAVIRGNRAF